MIKDMKKPERHYNYIPYRAGGIEEKEYRPAVCDGPEAWYAVLERAHVFLSMLRGAAFDVELEERIAGQSKRYVLVVITMGVCINLPYNLGWGRSQETYGEESFQFGQMGSAFIGVQSET